MCARARLLFPMTPDVVPPVSDLIPMVRDPVLATAFGYPRAGDPMEKATIPLPIALRPSISIAVWRLVFDTGRRRGHIAYDVGPRRSEPEREQRAGNYQCPQRGLLQRLHVGQPFGLAWPSRYVKEPLIDDRTIVPLST